MQAETYFLEETIFSQETIFLKRYMKVAIRYFILLEQFWHRTAEMQNSKAQKLAGKNQKADPLDKSGIS
jgi:hypothetical protein